MKHRQARFHRARPRCSHRGPCRPPTPVGLHDDRDRRRSRQRRSWSTATSSATSRRACIARGSAAAVMLGWQKRTPFAGTVTIDGRAAQVTHTPFYDPQGSPCASLSHCTGVRVVAAPGAIDAARVAVGGRRCCASHPTTLIVQPAYRNRRVDDPSRSSSPSSRSCTGASPPPSSTWSSTTSNGRCPPRAHALAQGLIAGRAREDQWSKRITCC